MLGHIVWLVAISFAIANTAVNQWVLVVSAVFVVLGVAAALLGWRMRRNARTYGPRSCGSADFPDRVVAVRPWGDVPVGSAVMAKLQTLVSGRAFLEGPRWHEGLYVSDMHAHEVLRIGIDGAVEVFVQLDTAPSGLGWLPDGRMLIVLVDDRRVLCRGDDGTLTEHADLGDLAPHEINDMVVDAAGHAFVSQFGCDLIGGELPKPAPLLRVDQDGSAHEVTDGLNFANGMVITADGETLVVAESAGQCLTAFSPRLGRHTFRPAHVGTPARG